MTIREFYDETGGDFQGVLNRFLKEERMLRFLRMFPKDPSYGQLESSLAEKNIEEAFRAAHTLKGVCLNMGLSRLYSSSSDVTEALRASDLQGALGKMDDLRRDYREVINDIEKL